MRSAAQPLRLGPSTRVLLVVVGLVGVIGATRPARAQPPLGDNLWNFRQNADDRFHSNEAWLRPWRGSSDDGWGCWVGGYSYELAWGPQSTVGSSDGSLTISRDRDYQFHAWTYVYVAVGKTITLNGDGDCVPRVFLNCAFDVPMEFPVPLALVGGWNRIDITGYNQNSGYTFTCSALAALVDIMSSTLLPPNKPPVAVGGGPYVKNEGAAVLFDGSGSADPDGDALQYRWDFDDDGVWDTDWSPNPTASYTWGDNRTGTARLEVSDGEFSEENTVSVTVGNVAPTASIDSVSRPNPAMILPNQVLTLVASFSDAGWLDTHSCTWVFGDGVSESGTVVEEQNAPDATGTSTIQHCLFEPGDLQRDVDRCGRRSG